MSDYSKALRVLMKSPVTQEMITLLVTTTENVMDLKRTYPTPPSSPLYDEEDELPTLREFICKLVEYTHVYTPTLLMTISYLNRLRRILPKGAAGIPSTLHRIFLACLIISAKNHNDSSPLNRHWTKYTDGLFTLEDVNLMERHLLDLLNWNLHVDEKELIHDLKPLLKPMVHVKKSVYDFKRNISVGSNISSSSTLVDSRNNSAIDLKLEYRTEENKSASKATDKRMSWNLEEIMREHNFI
ncbi:hypothetical protein KAFR_0A08280 [Kazachstania africana CBS 2517]|uniref:Cyclin-like domain-containing protein n=1 Tax=Kazachstania africana (strain ATCC 22294 / BCRC 22015 / CBS 2517 / CECT 1963 / NBRC 1671 / NRRL Y-8276) TaxID=1071382 RepID=H2APG2_KAZAF|nr:hypothetical protein KAFR_0A08280 [Kazachstania africana CBS 2517]CCF56262.1 hypothetical protein KAFR_0A08280 [Kazachstania africana CBS 2517]